jgi:hypothetical protein
VGENALIRSTKAVYQEIFTEFVEGAKLYSIKPLQNGIIPSLADLLEVSAENLQILFKNAGLGKLRQRQIVQLPTLQNSKAFGPSS